MSKKTNIQLFMLHFSGGNSYSFQFLKPFVPTNFDFHMLELPGRGKRMQEKLLLTEREAIEDLITQIVSRRNNQPYLLFGHSMGASLGLTITKRLEELGDPPKQLIVAGNAGPGIGDKKKYSKMSNDELKEELKMLGGVSDEILNDDDIFNFFVPIMKADFRIIEESESLAPGFRLESPITAIMGDKEETSEQIENWRNYTSKEFAFHHLPGNHFFILDHPFKLMKIITNCYDKPLHLNTKNNV